MNVIFYLLYFCLATQSAAEGQRLDAIRTTISFRMEDVSFKKIENYDAVYLRGATTTLHPGMPMLPVKCIQIAIPAGTRVTRLEVTGIDTIDLSDVYYLMPEQEPRPIGMAGAFGFTKPDVKTYTSTIYYPGKLAELDAQGSIAGQAIAWVLVYPLQYLPATGKLVLHKTIELTLQCSRDQGKNTNRTTNFYKFTANQRLWYTEMIKRLVINPDAVCVYPAPGARSFFLPTGEFDHVVITADNLVLDFDPLTYWHNKKGLRDTVVTTEWIYANYPGPDDTLKIRQFVIDANASWGTVYFLIGGEYETVPCAWRTYYSENTPSDQYYSDFNDDWVNEVFVGRVSAGSTAEVSRFINKLLLYEKSPPLVDYPLEVCLCGMDLDANTHGEILMEQIASYLPGQFIPNKVYDSHTTNHRTEFLGNLNNGQNIVGHCDHGETELMATGWVNHYWTIHNIDVDLLSNDTKLSNLISVGCKTTALDHSDCIAEHFVVYNNDQAGISYTGNTRDGYYSSGNPFALSSELNDWWWNGLFVLDQDDLGKALVHSKHRFSTLNNSLREHCEWTFNLLGDPAMPIWTGQPESLLALHAGTVPACTSDFIVSVTEVDGTTQVSGALVCCWIKGQLPAPLYARTFTDSLGLAVLIIAPTTPGDTVEVTVTKHNYLPYEGYAVVVPATGALEYSALLAGEDITGLSVQPNPFKDAITIIYVLKSAAEANIKIYSVAGYLMKSIDIRQSGKAGVISWNGRDTRGNRLPGGIYFMIFRTKNCERIEKIIMIR